MQYLCYAYDIPYPTFKRWKADAFQTAEKNQPHKGKTIFTSMKLATQVFNPRRMYCDHHMAVWLQKNPHRKYDPAAKKVHTHLHIQYLLQCNRCFLFAETEGILSTEMGRSFRA